MSYLTRTVTASLMFVSLAIASTHAQENTRRGAWIGGATGAVIGGVIGHNKKDQTAEGALIGGAVGAVAGGLIGHQRDQVIAEQQRQANAYRYPSYPTAYRSYPAPRTYPSQRYGSPSPWYSAPGQPTIVYSAPVVTRHGIYGPPARFVPSPSPPRQPVALSDVIYLTRHGVSDAVIVSRIQANGMAQIPSVDDVVMLSREGVSDYVITAMQNQGAVETMVDPNPNADMPQEYSEPSGARWMEPPPRSSRRGF